MNRTARTAVAIVLACLILSHVSCGPGRDELIRSGDASMSLDRPDEAVTHYGRALEKDPNLLDSSIFMTKLRQAKTQDAYRKGTAHAAKKDWEAAIASFQKCLDTNPKYRQADDALRNARRQGAQAHHKKALHHADQGDLNRAIGELKRALELDPANLDAKDALKSIEQRKVRQTGQAGTLYASARTMQQEKRWLKSSDALGETIKLNLNHLPARADLHRCRTKLAGARSAYHTGATHLEAKRLDKAVEALSGAVEIWPFFSDADRALTKATTQRRQAEDLYTRAVALAKQNQWDDVVEAADAALRIYPYHAQARPLLPKARQNASDAHCDRGQTLLTAGHFDAADVAFQRAAYHVPHSLAARTGQARADTLRGQAAEKKQLWGNALVSYMKASDHLATRDLAQKIRAMRPKVIERIAFTIGLTARAAGGRAIVDTDDAVSSMRARLRGESLQFVSAAAGRGDYAATLQLNAPHITTRETDRRDRTYHYTIHRKVPNPEIPRLRGLVRTGQGDLDRMSREYKRLCRTCGGKGKTKCSTCGGTRRHSCVRCGGGGRARCSHCRGAGKVAHRTNCAHCSATGKRSCSTCGGRGKSKCSPCGASGKTACSPCKGTGKAGDRNCAHCGASGKVTCSSCSGRGHGRCGHCSGAGRSACSHCRGAGHRQGHRNCTHCSASGKGTCSACQGRGWGKCGTCNNSTGHVTCSSCNGRGRATSVTRHDLDHKRRSIDELEWKLRRAPDRVTRGFPAEWGYVECTHTKSGVMDATVTLLPPAAGLRTGWSFTLRDTTSSSDTVIENANPDVGLHQDELDLPSDRTLAAGMVRSLARQAAYQIIATAINAEVANARKSVSTAASKDDATALVEATVDLAHLLEWSNKREALRLLNALHAEHKSQATIRKRAATTALTTKSE